MAHWHGFIDHESGVKLYRVGLAERCLDEDELSRNASIIISFSEVLFSETSVVFHTNRTGKMFVTVVAFNNAMEPSLPACSDGITRDNKPPNVANIVLQNSKWSESIICVNNTAWLMHSVIARIELIQSSNCQKRCSNFSYDSSIFSAIPVLNMSDSDEAVSDFMCETLQDYTPDTIIFLPTDQIYLHWDVTESVSQIHDYSIGFGDDPLGRPNIVAYQSTDRKSYYRRKHEGLGENTIFYIFIKVVNRASMEKVTIFGPVLIDESPPLYKEIPSVYIENNFAVVGWENDTFYDMEQTAQINEVYFQIGICFLILANTFIIHDNLNNTIAKSIVGHH